jgi:hypothetical protein
MGEPMRRQDLGAADSIEDVEARNRTDRELLAESEPLDRRKPVRSESILDAGDRPEIPAATGSEPPEYTGPAPLLSASDIGDLRGRWNTVQASFVDEPRRAVAEADKLVAAVTERLTACFANERSILEKQWDRGEEVSTEDLRMALQQYRTFFSRLLNM